MYLKLKLNNVYDSEKAYSKYKIIYNQNNSINYLCLDLTEAKEPVKIFNSLQKELAKKGLRVMVED